MNPESGDGPGITRGAAESIGWSWVLPAGVVPLINDRMKLLAYRMHDSAATTS